MLISADYSSRATVAYAMIAAMRRAISLLSILLLTACASAPTVEPTPMPTPTSIEPQDGLPTTAGIHQLTLKEKTFTLYLPEDYDSSKAYPLVVSLHYAGYNGAYYGRGLLEFAMIDGFQALQPIIVAPDSPGWSSPSGEAIVVSVTEHILSNYNIDRERVLISGYSMGGGGTWYVAARNQDIFTAAMPMAAMPAGNSAEVDWQIPILVLNSRADELFDFDRAEQLAKTVADAGATLNFVAVDDISHYRAEAYSTPIKDALPWLIEQWGSKQ